MVIVILTCNDDRGNSLYMQSVPKMRSTVRGKRPSIVHPEQTLHHFFKNVPQQQETSKSKFTSQEIIVIDSDNDDVDKLEPSKPVKRPRLSDVDIDLTLGEDWDDDRSFEFNDWMLNHPDIENPLPATIKQSSNPQLQVSSSSCMVTRQTLVSCDGNVKPGNNAFSILMSSVKESEVWKEASIDTKTSGPPQTGTSGRRKVPFYKVLQGMPIAVDAFNFGKIQGVTAYFLTSVHLVSSLAFNF